jgi:hypothetical protein
MSTKPKLVNKIWVPYGNRVKLAQQFGVTLQTVRAACNYASASSVKQDEIRREALRAYGGRKIKVPSAITT